MREVEPLQTDRFTLRPLQRSDAAALFPTLSDPEQCLYLTRPAFESEDELWGWLSDPDWHGRTWIAEDSSGTVAARVTAHTAHQDGVDEIGYIVCADWQGQGVALECTRALVAHLFANGARKLIAEVDTRNTASFRLLEKLGFAREGLFREHEATHAGMCDVYWYGLLKGDAEQDG